MTETSNLNELEAYLPSSSEKKQAVMMYMVVGLILSMWKWEVSPYTHHHLKQSLGWLVFLVLTVFADLILGVLWLIISFFFVFVVIITIPALSVWIMWIYQAQQGKYIWENEIINKFFSFFSWIGNWTLNLFDSNHYQIIDKDRYRSEDQFYTKNTKLEKVEEKVEEKIEENDINNQPTTQNLDDLNIQNQQINNTNLDWKTLDNNQQNVINNQNIWIDLSGHEINNPENQINN